MLKEETYKYYPGCAGANKDCFCVKDEHCAPGFACVPSKAFPDYNICKPDWCAFGFCFVIACTHHTIRACADA
jgi:hypothetical protein